MEIFQTIWTALTMENELLTNILFLPINMIETTLNMLIFTLILNINSNKKVKLKYIISGTLILYLNGLFIPNPYRSYINIIIFPIINMLFFKISIVKAIIAAILPIFITVLCESVIIKLYMHIFNFDIASITTVPLFRIVIVLTVQLFTFMVYLFIKYSKVQISLLENMSLKSKRIFILNFIFAILAISIQFFITGFYLNRLPIYIVIFSNLSLIAYFLLSIYSLTKTTKLELTSLNLEQEKEYNKSLKSLQDELHTFRHDFSNIMCTIGGYVQVKDIEGLSKYYYQIQKDINKVNTLGALSPETINNPAIYALISSKYNKALEYGIDMNINVFLNLNNLNMKIYEFTRTLGILLDNAIEASKECSEKIINIEIRKDTNRNRQLLIIENTYNNKDVDTEKIFDKKYSTKEGNSGLGLWEVRQILKKNNNLNLFTTKDDKFFKQQLEMYNQ